MDTSTFSCQETDDGCVEIKIKIRFCVSKCCVCECDVDANFRALFSKKFPMQSCSSKSKRIEQVMDRCQTRLQDYAIGIKPQNETKNWIPVEKIYCQSCLGKVLLSSQVQNNGYLQSNDGQLISDNIIRDLKAFQEILSEEDSEKLEERIKEQLILRDNYQYFCPVVENGVPCTTFTLYKKYFAAGTRTTNCCRHGRRCVRCWEFYDEEGDHPCSNYPKSVFTIECTNLFRCTYCLAIIQKEYGCNDIDCKCGRSIRGDQCYIRTTNKNLVPLRLVPKDPKIRIDARPWSLSKPKKQPKTRQFRVDDWDDESDEEENFCEEIWLDQKRMDPRSVY